MAMFFKKDDRLFLKRGRVLVQTPRRFFKTRSCFGRIVLLYLNFTFGVSGMVLCRIYHHMLVSGVLLVRILV